MKWKKIDIADSNYLNIITNTNEPSQEMVETNQSEDPINPELNEENPELNEENIEDELQENLN